MFPSHASGESVFETMDGIINVSTFQIQRYGCDMANTNHRADIKHVLKTILSSHHMEL